LEALAADAVAVYAPTSGAEIEALWRWREGIGVAADSAMGGKISEDISVPLHALADTIQGTIDIGADHDLSACSWGHAGDGNLHSTFLFDREDTDALARARDAAGDLFRLAIRLGGSISGEHGVGTVKLDWLGEQQSDDTLQLNSGIRRLFDPRAS
jgi:FAD/FMN-containing dehydrogenase